jgi:hypothetical protein
MALPNPEAAASIAAIAAAVAFVTRLAIFHPCYFAAAMT